MFILPQIIHNQLNMFYLTWSQASYIKHLRSNRVLHVSPQQIIGADMKEIRNPYQHIYGWHDIIIFSIADALLFHS